MVACLTSFPQLFVSSKKKPVYKASESFIQRLRTKTQSRKRENDYLSTNLSATQDLTGILVSRDTSQHFCYVTVPGTSASDLKLQSTFQYLGNEQTELRPIPLPKNPHRPESVMTRRAELYGNV
jgi:hypothetical protein